MALSFPTSVASFFEEIAPVAATMYDMEPTEYTQLGGGDIIKASLGAALWRGQITLPPLQHRDAAAVEAKLSVMNRAGSSFLVYDYRLDGPRNDPGGALLGSPEAQINSISTSNRELSLKLLPANYVLSAGDMISFNYGSNPTRYALHRVVTGITANGSGITGLFEVTPRIRAGAAVSANVTLSQAVCKAIMVPGIQFGQAAARLTQGASFEFVQTLR